MLPVQINHHSTDYKTQRPIQHGAINKLNSQLKADANAANGGVGVSYSNVVLGGPFDAGVKIVPSTSYQAHYALD
jgi:hypothetical protein